MKTNALKLAAADSTVKYDNIFIQDLTCKATYCISPVIRLKQPAAFS